MRAVTMASQYVSILATLALLLASAPTGAQYQQASGFEFVDPLIGTVDGGHVFPGATLPFGMAKAVADVSGENQGGFGSDGSSITGFSHMHDSGTGGASSMGNFPLFPVPGCPDNDVKKCLFAKSERAVPRINGSAKAHPGYFTVSLSTGIAAEMTVTKHATLYRFKLPNNSSAASSSPLFLLDLTDLPDTRSEGYANVAPSTGRITANGTFEPSFGKGNYRMYTCVDWKGAKVKDVGSWLGDEVRPNVSSVTVMSRATSAGAWLRFEDPEKDNTILSRVGVSFISIAQACKNAEDEIPGFGFDEVLSAAEDAWREKLSVITIDAGDVSTALQKVFWSGIYRSMISPQDYTGENPLWESDEPYYDSYYCIWDSFRSIHQLITILDPKSQTSMIRSLIDIYRHEGFLPDCRMSLCKGWTQGGSNADVVLSDSFLKNITEGVDWNVGYEAVVADAEKKSPDWGVEGRGGLESWRTVNYIPKDDTDLTGSGPFTRSVSRTVEYAYNDFCIALMAKELGHTADYEKYLERSGYWKNVYKSDQTSFINGEDTGFVGFLQPRLLDGSWDFQDPIRCSYLLDFTSCYLNQGGGESYEGTLWMYTFYVPGDHRSLIQTLGGKEAFLKRLDYLHERNDLLYVGDEQAFLTIYQYNYAGRPGKSAHRIHTYIPSQFNDTIVGIPGNDDSGAMGSFVVFSMMGFFPNPGQNVYLISTPFFPSISIKSGQTGNTATIKAINFDSGYKNIYVQNAKLNEETYTKNWFTHDFFLQGGTLELTMGPEESDWGTSDEDVPPSLGPENAR